MGSPAPASPAVCRAQSFEDRCWVVALAERIFVDFGDYRAIIDQWMDTPRVTALLLFEEDRRCGFALVAQHRGVGFWRSISAELVAIALEPEARGRGLGRLLLRSAEDLARGFEANEMRLHTAEENTIARLFFAAAGYRERDERVAAYPNGQPAIELSRPLT